MTETTSATTADLQAVAELLRQARHLHAHDPRG